MFSGLNNFFKKFLPKGLFYRSLIIVAAPIILLQLIVTVVFFDSIWIKANKGMTRSLVGEIKTLSDVYNSENQNQINYITDIYKRNFDFVINSIDESIPVKVFERRFSPMDRSLRRELKSTFGNNNYWFNTVNYLDIVEVRIRSGNKNLQFFFPKERIATSSVRLFVLWITLPSIILIFIAILFLKNQTRPISNLAKAAQRFGKGDYINEFRPSGAREIRNAAYEFDRMAKRINRHLNQRSEMLSGISHDLRTPLTRLKLQLAMINNQQISSNMSKDIDEMENMLNDYLQFAKTQAKENTEKINIKNIFKIIENRMNNPNLKFDIKNEISFYGRKNALERCFSNIINNGLVYGKKITVSVQKSSNRAIIFFDDDGPGIPIEQYRNVFKPFFRLDKSRSLNKSGVGLGLAIVEDIVHSHGGNIQLSKSDMGGLQVKISLPF
ncbi:MAG: HAMP domain-containing protein [Candidatus Pelagibacter sp. TMED263]|mgnify:CR=1 FL=1|nr:MAG: HAMP domain-containing protein [Candidatus Pelagibacter sp. TMED263]|tara:strand:- start:954 stop:2273 length:1320 start_codon:yes stop_codon:yes gene_type:complete